MVLASGAITVTVMTLVPTASGQSIGSTEVQATAGSPLADTAAVMVLPLLTVGVKTPLVTAWATVLV